LLRKIMIWDKPKILAKIKQLHRAGRDLSYNAMCRRMQSLVSAAAYHFGSYRDAVVHAGIDYAVITRRPRWTRKGIIQLIKQGRRKGEELHWSAVIQRRDELGKAAFASLQPRLFGRWDRALTAAGLDPDDIARYRKWNRSEIVFELRRRSQDDEAINSGALQQDDPGLHAAAVRHFGSYDAALIAARIDPGAVRRRKAWTPPVALAAVKQMMRAHPKWSNSAVRRQNPALYGACVRLFGSFAAAKAAAVFDSKPKRQSKRSVSKSPRKASKRTSSSAARRAISKSHKKSRRTLASKG
jgi:hypothetical protein